VIGQERFFQLGKTIEPDRFDDPVTRQVFVDVVGDGTGQMSGHRQEADPKLGAGPRVAAKFQDARVQRQVDDCHRDGPAGQR
jgi:hypothetical protein